MQIIARLCKKSSTVPCIHDRHALTPLLPATLPPNKCFDGVAEEGLLLPSTLRKAAALSMLPHLFFSHTTRGVATKHLARNSTKVQHVDERRHYQSPSRRYYKSSKRPAS